MNRRCFVLLGCLVALAGCGKEPTAPANAPASANLPSSAGAGAPSPQAAGSSTVAVTTASLDAVQKADKPYTIALIVKTRNNPFFKPMIDNFEKTCHDLGVTSETEAPEQESDSEKQAAFVQTLVAKGVNAILIAPANSIAIIPSLKAAADKGVLVINLDNRVDAAAASAQQLKLGGYVGADNEAGGKLAGKAMADALASGGSVAVLEGIRGADNAEARKRGFTAGLNSKAKIVDSETANWDTSQAYNKTADILAAHSDIKGLFCANDKMAVGALKALSEKGLAGKVTVIGYDDIPDVQAALRSGELAATIEQHPDLMGKYGARMAIGILEGKVPTGGEIMVPLEVIKKR